MSIFPLLSALLAFPAAPQGGSFGFGEAVELPSSSPQDADHAAVAINSDGDLLAVFSSERFDLSPRAFQVEAFYLSHLGSGAWSAPDAAVNRCLLGSAKSQAFGLAYEACRKPDVVAVGRDFYVVWPRSSEDRLLHRLEMARVAPDGLGGFRVDAPGPGVGYVVDAQIDGQVAGIMPDLVEVPGQAASVAVVYVDDELQAEPLREFDLRFLRADFGSLPPAVDGPHVLVDSATLDDTALTTAPFGGKVLPDVVRDDSGNLVLAYESYVRSGHLGAPADIGRVWLTWFADSGSGVPVPLQSHEFRGQRRSDPVRRPKLATSRMDATNSVSIAMMHLPDQQQETDTGYYEATWDGTTITSVDLLYPNSGALPDSMPTPVHGATLRACLGTRGNEGHTHLVAFLQSLTGGLISIPATREPWRPASDLMEPGPSGSGASTCVPITYEAVSAAGPVRVFLRVDRR
ncbi:MAG: hypothetical protein EYC70_07345 [Planctomycetota bacterium]|nr:MAG: hypothetical protein EYC70_07345 [Planctomycetota bacterium]